MDGRTAPDRGPLVTAADIARLVARDPALASLAVVLDPQRRHDAGLGECRVNRLRYKPGASIVASVTTDGEGEPITGWIAAYSDHGKVTKTLARAARSGFSARAVDGIPGVVVGETTADRQLAGTFAEIRTAEPTLFTASRILRHNPHRRVILRSVLAGTQVVVKVSAGETTEHPGWTVRSNALQALERQGVAVLRPTALASVVGVETVPWWGNGDLATLPEITAARAAGRDLALLHSSSTGTSAASSMDPAGSTAADIERAGVHAAARAVALVLPGVAHRTAHLDQALRRHSVASAYRRTLVHGDFSPDQVLVGQGEIRLIDFDRAAIDSAERDLGSFLASADLLGHPALGDAMLDGYVTAGGTVDDSRVHRFTAIAFLQRAVEPFRCQVPDWAARTRYALERAESEVAQC
jgi:hypothetical protein